MSCPFCKSRTVRSVRHGRMREQCPICGSYLMEDGKTWIGGVNVDHFRSITKEVEPSSPDGKNGQELPL
jgi:hypothetical protein